MLCQQPRDQFANDDSLCVIRHGGPQVWRPPWLCAQSDSPGKTAGAPRLAMGAEIKNTIAVGFDNHVVISPHIGDLETPEAIAGLEQVAATLPRFSARA